MCGIFSFIGSDNGVPLVINGLRKLEYRGYDSAGLAIFDQKLQIHKCKGRIDDLQSSLPPTFKSSKVVIGHTRWATHGPPNDVNAHPHTDHHQKLAIVHNGIIENFQELNTELKDQGIFCESETDTEVLIKLIGYYQERYSDTLREAIVKVLRQVHGSYSFVVLDESQPDQLIGARKGSPLVFGYGHQGYFLASDILPIIEHTPSVVYMNDGEIVQIDTNGARFFDFDHQELFPPIHTVSLNRESVGKMGFKHFMMKEIHEQPTVLKKGLSRFSSTSSFLPEINPFLDRMSKSERIIILGCGTSWHAGLVAEYILESWVRIPVEVEYASEFRYRNPVLKSTDLIIALSQSGETADTIVALEEAQNRDVFTYGIVNAENSSIARMVDVFSHIHAGPELAVASTKAFVCQLMTIYLFGLKLAQSKACLSTQNVEQYLSHLQSIPDQMAEFIANQRFNIQLIAKQYHSANHALFLGRGVHFPIALEGALKLKEVSYIHAEGYPAAEMKHGPIALIEKGWPVIIIALKSDPFYDKICSNIAEINARGGSVIGIIEEGDERIQSKIASWIEIPSVDFMLSPLLAVLPLQLLAYEIGLHKGCDVDKPRNLAKSVTVE